ncbi:MAG: hypothetical protein JRH07_11920 [Deltaproteobacteria bacterium]|nr:hypothetical protein [Deltaproteobacteria bacterium]MBW2122539.1 hypothetical protein [Deltaproteobacteria bacterium]
MRAAVSVWLLLLAVTICPVLAAAGETSGSLWTDNAKTAAGRSYLDGFVRGYIEGNRLGLDLLQGILPYARFDPGSRIDKNQLQSKLRMQALYYARALEGETLRKTVDQITKWYEDPRNQRILWGKLVNLAIGKVNGLHPNYIRYELKWLQETSAGKSIDWFHTIDPATGEGRVNYYDKNGRIMRTEWVR